MPMGLGDLLAYGRDSEILICLGFLAMSHDTYGFSLDGH